MEDKIKILKKNRIQQENKGFEHFCLTSKLFLEKPSKLKKKMNFGTIHKHIKMCLYTNYSVSINLLLRLNLDTKGVATKDFLPLKVTA